MCTKGCKGACNCACKAEAGARGPQGVAGPMGPQGLPGLPGFLGWSLLGNTVTNSTSVLGSTDNFPFSFITNNIERARFLSTGEFGIGTATPSTTLHVVGEITQDVTYTNIVADVFAFDQTVTIDSPVDSVFNIFGMNSLITIPIGNTSNYPGTQIGHLIEFDHNGQGMVGSPGNIVFGVNGTINNNSTGDIDTAAGLLGSANNNGGGSVNILVGLAAQVGNFGAGAVTTAVGLLIVSTDNSGGGTIGQVIGIDIKDQSGVGTSSSWNFLSEGINSLNIFEGSIGIANGSPTAMLHIGATNTGTFRYEDGNQASGFVLTSDASGNATWQAESITTVTGSGNIASSGGSTPNITFTGILPIANGGTNIGTIGAAGTSIYSNGTQHVSTAVGVSGQVLTSAGAGTPTWTNPSSVNWSLLGNSGTVDGTNFLGTIDNIPLNFRVNNQKSGRIDPTLFNVFLGYQAGNANTSGANNVVIGHQAFLVSTVGDSSVAIGYKSLTSNTSGDNNTAVGWESLLFNTTGTSSTAIGAAALLSNTVGSFNVSIGFESSFSNVAGSSSVAIGTRAMYYTNNTAVAFTNTNVAIGFEALLGSVTAANNTGLDNSVIGHQSTYNNTSGSKLVAIGKDSLTANTTGIGNIAVGFGAGLSGTTGSYNIYLGTDITGTLGITTGSFNTILGSQITGLGNVSNNIVISDGAGVVRLQFDNTGALTLTGPAVSAAVATASTDKVKVNVNGTDYYLLATTIP